jgi:glycosyltransferase involved in cell wall biosynthesis
MNILYSAIDQTVPGTTGGSVHVAAVAEGLAALGHDVTALVTPGAPRGGQHPTGVRWVPMAPPLGSTHLRMARASKIAKLATALRPDVVIERYHNFGGEALTVARSVGALAVLEVNAPVVDYPGSGKAIVDRALLVRPMQRWRERLCRMADLIVTPDAGILPRETPSDRVRVLEWGADTDRFRPDVPAPAPFQRPSSATVAVFAGAFRSWHGAINLARALRILQSRGRRDVGAVFVGNGPELPRVRAEADGVDHLVFAGALPHDAMPAALAASDVGVAPFEPSAHPPLTLGFYWSPLKIFEYMAAGLPVVAPSIPRIQKLVEHGREGLLYDPGVPEALADALVELTDAPLRARLGGGARERAVREYSWAAHCRALDAAFHDARQRRSA